MIRSAGAACSGRAARTVAGRVTRRVVGTVLAAGVGALVVTLVVAVTSGPAPLVADPDAPARPLERPSRAQARAAEPSGAILDRLLPAARWTSPSPGLEWGTVRTELHEPRALAGSCHRFPLVSLGAIRVAHRAYVLGPPAAPRAGAEHVVARFADPRTAWRAREVLLAWQAGCTETLAGTPRLRVFPVQDLAHRVHRYAVAWGSDAASARLREDVALVREGTRLALLRVTASATDDAWGPAVVLDAVPSARGLLER